MFAGLAGDMGDPRQLAKALEGTKATVVSSTGDATTYDVTIDPSALLGGASAAPSAGPVKARYTLDAQSRPTAMVVEVQGQSVKITFGDWGRPVNIKAPPADQVGTFTIPTS
jgi:polyisoprenoid-binding protein YceI